MRTLRSAIILAVLLDFITPRHGIMQADAQAGPNSPNSGNSYVWQNAQQNPLPEQVVDSIALQQRLSVNSDGSLNAKPVVASTAGGSGGFTITSTSTVVIPQGAKRFIAIDNESASVSIACSFGGTAALNTAGSFTIPPQSVRVWNGVWVPADAVACISGAATSAATIQVN